MRGPLDGMLGLLERWEGRVGVQVEYDNLGAEPDAAMLADHP